MRVTAAATIQPEHVVVVVGHRRDQVEAHLAEIAPHVTTAVQEQQRAPGMRSRSRWTQLGDLDGEVVVTYGDVPMLSAETLAALLAEHRSRQAAITVLTAQVPDPTGYGRILRDAGRTWSRRSWSTVMPTTTQRAITEINSGIYVFEAKTLRAGLAELTPTNDQGELYLTDVLRFRPQGRPCRSAP